MRVRQFRGVIEAAVLASGLLCCQLMNAHAPVIHPENENCDETSPRAKAPVAAPSRAEFEAHVLPHAEELFGTALRYTKNRGDAEDLVQETMMRALAAWPRFIPGSNARAWLFRILTNSFINNYRRKKRHRRFAHETGDDAAVAVYGDDVERSSNPHRQLLEQQLGDEVTHALNSLGADYRKVVELADLRGARYRDIADALGLPIGTVMSRLFRARRQLEELLRDFAAADYGIRRAA